MTHFPHCLGLGLFVWLHTLHCHCFAGAVWDHQSDGCACHFELYHAIAAMLDVDPLMLLMPLTR